MSASGDIAVLRFGDDGKWHWLFLTPTVLSTFSFNASQNPSLSASPTWSTLPGAPTLSPVATSGSYADLTSKPSLGTQMSVDSGWTGNNTAGDKTAALSSYSNGVNSTMITALNVVSGGTGTAIGAAFDVLVIVVKKLAALETVLAAGKLPSA